MSLSLRGAAAVVLLVSLLPASGLAQTNADVGAGLQFSFVPPGARSLAMGGAFTGLADDATAAWTNPAGLLNLPLPEVSLEVRDATYTNHYPSGGSFQPNPSAVGEGSSDASVTNLSFASYVHPGSSGRWAAAVFFHQLSDFRAEQHSEPILGVPPTSQIAAIGRRDSFFDLQIPGFGLAGALRLSDSFTLGASLLYYDYELDSETRFTPLGGSPANTMADRQVVTGDDTSIAGNVGLQWSGASNRLSLVYRRGPSFDAEFAYVCGTPGTGSNACNSLQQGQPVPGLFGTSTLKAPDSIAVGWAWNVNPRLTLAAEANHVYYSQVSDEIKSVTTIGRNDPNYPSQFTMDDVTELHLGGEFSVPLRNERGFYLRAGAWIDPDHRLRFKPDDPSEAELYEKVVVRFNSTSDDDEIHVTGGLGVTFGTRFQLDVGADFSDLSDIFSASAVVRF